MTTVKLPAQQTYSIADQHAKLWVSQGIQHELFEHRKLTIDSELAVLIVLHAQFTAANLLGWAPRGQLEVEPLA